MLQTGLTRRRALTILAATFACPANAARLRTDSPDLFEWRGTALGADARILFAGPDTALARSALAAALAEIERLEAIFSLYRPDSEIVHLNRHKRLANASVDLRRLLHLCRSMKQNTNGLFDPTIQSLWLFYADWFGRKGKQTWPQGSQIERIRRSVGIENVVIDGATVMLHNAANITLNGIAQGYITDRVAVLLRSRGWRGVLLDLGETRALDARQDDTPWRISVRGSDAVIPLTNGALATSAADAMVFSESVSANHIINPTTAMNAPVRRHITVRHHSATIADALSTSLVLAPNAQVSSILGHFPTAQVWRHA